MKFCKTQKSVKKVFKLKVNNFAEFTVGYFGFWKNFKTSKQP